MSWLFSQALVANAAVRPTLGAMAKHNLWPTPTVSGNYNKAGASAKSGDGLATAVAKAWPTPTASFLCREGGRVTPRKSREGGKASQATHDRNARPLSEQIGGSLNPTWVEWLMGWPLGWTDLKPWATARCRSAPPPRGSS